MRVNWNQLSQEGEVVSAANRSVDCLVLLLHSLLCAILIV